MAGVKKINTFKAFQHRNYALYFSGQSLSMIGTWMQRTGVSWMVYTITHSTFMLGFSIFAAQFPSFIFSLYGGVLSDRYNRHKILIITQTASLLQALLLAVLTITHHYNVTVIIILSVVLGIVNAFDIPARQPLIHDMITDKADLPNALALNASMVNLARLIGPALSGIILQQFGAGICFLLNAISFLAVIGSLLLMKITPYKATGEPKKTGTELREGFLYLKQTPAISMMLLMLTLVSLLVLPYDTLVPVFAKEIFNGNAATYGYISSFMGLGAIIGTLLLASIQRAGQLKKLLLINTLILSLGLMLFAYAGHLALAMLFAAICGFGAMSQNTTCLTIIQVNVSAHMRGRVMSFVAMAYFGMLPLGSLLVGSISQHIGAPNTVFCQGIISLLIALVFYRILKKEKSKT